MDPSSGLRYSAYPSYGDSLGDAIFGGVDVNGDGLSDVLVGAPTSGTDLGGSVHVVYGRRGRHPAKNWITAPDALIRGEMKAAIGMSISAADINGDGIVDILVGGVKGVYAGPICSSECAGDGLILSADGKSCVECPGGTEPVNGTCRACPGGMFRSVILSHPMLSRPLVSPDGVSFDDQPWESIAGSSRCIPCPVGMYSSPSEPKSLEACATCPQGTYADEKGMDHCKPCPGGTYRSAFAAMMDAEGWTPALVYGTGGGCLPCSAGMYSTPTDPNTLRACELCPKGTYADEPGQDGCTPCPEGTYNDVMGASSKDSCTPCPRGTFGPVRGATEASICWPCGPGTYAADVGAWRCTACPKGTYSNATGLDTVQGCVRCPNHGVMTTPEVSAQSIEACMFCPRGTYPSGGGECFPCPKGTYAKGAPGADLWTTCAPAPPGTYTDMEASTEPTPCPEETFGSSTPGAASADSCVACPQGTVAKTKGATACTPCPGGMWYWENGITKCREPDDFVDKVDFMGMHMCPPGSSPWEYTGCTKCVAGTYSR
jgi:hypothetical protein